MEWQTSRCLSDGSPLRQLPCQPPHQRPSANATSNLSGKVRLCSQQLEVPQEAGGGDCLHDKQAGWTSLPPSWFSERSEVGGDQALAIAPALSSSKHLPTHTFSLTLLTLNAEEAQWSMEIGLRNPGLKGLEGLVFLRMGGRSSTR